MPETGNGLPPSDSPTLPTSPTTTPENNPEANDQAEMREYLKRSRRLQLAQYATAIQAQRAGLDWEQRAVERDTLAAHRALYGEHALDDASADPMGDLYLGDVYLGDRTPRLDSQPPIGAQSRPAQRTSNAAAILGAGALSALMGAGGALLFRGPVPAIPTTPTPVVSPAEDHDTRNALRFDDTPVVPPR